tara:strand:+ start:1104 stop:1982 length:879 start_codon:yes stop_codon:yes gene_type:complete
MSDIVKKETSTELKATDPITFGITPVSKSKINPQAVALVNEFLPELDEKTKFFDRNNSQSTLSMMSLTMLNGHSPLRMLRQVLAETETRKMALAEAQVSHAKALKNIEKLQEKVFLNPDNKIASAKLRAAFVGIESMESKINGSFKDIATLITAYNNLKENYGIEDWTEEEFEESEKKHHVRRGFELMYRNLMDGGRASTSTIEYMQQYGIHPQVGFVEVQGYIAVVNELISKKQIPHSNHLEEFLDAMADKYYKESDKTTQRIFGKENITNTDIVSLIEKKDDETNSTENK